MDDCVLTCKCGSTRLKLETADEVDPSNWSELYQCRDCRAHGTIRVCGGREEHLGCLA